jgi:purine-binding chemotaxis protein CheW
MARWGERVRVLLLEVGQDSYALAVETVDRVMAVPPVTRVPGASPAVLGVFNLRGEIVPLFDLPRLIGTGETAGGSHVAVVRSPRGLAGLLASAAPVVAELGDPVAGIEGAGGRSIHDVEGHLASYVDIDEYFAAEDPALQGTGAGP